MIWQIAAKETREAWRDGRIKIGLLVGLVLCLAAMVVSGLDWRRQSHIVEDSQNQSRAHWVGQGEKNPHSAAHYGIYLFKPLVPLALLDKGVNSYAGTAVFTEAHSKNDADFALAKDRSSLARMGDLTPAFVLLYMVPLLIVLMGFNAMSRERELGTWRLLAGSGIPPRRILAGKWLALWLIPVVLTLFTLLVGGLALATKGQLDGGVLAGLGLLGLGYLLYLGVFVNITMVVSIVAKRSATAMTLLLAFWMISVLAAPRLGSSIAEQIYPTPNTTAFQKEMSEQKKAGLEGDPTQEERVALLRDETLAKYGAETVSDLPINYDALRMQTDEEYSNRVFDQYYASLMDTHRRQDNIYRGLSLFSPFITARFMSMGLARTDTAAHWHFNQEAEIYRRDYVKFLNDEMMHNSKTGDWGYNSDVSVWAEVPEFTATRRPLGEVFQERTPDVLILGAWWLLSALVLFVGLPKNIFRS